MQPAQRTVSNLTLRKRTLSKSFDFDTDPTDELAYAWCGNSEDSAAHAEPSAEENNNFCEPNEGATSNSSITDDSLSGEGPGNLASLRVGPEFQAEIPSISEDYSFDHSYCGELLWSPDRLGNGEVGAFVNKTVRQGNPDDALYELPIPRETVFTKEDSLLLLARCDYDPVKAERCFSSSAVFPLDSILTTTKSWTEKEVETFRRVMTERRLYKNFFEMQKYIPGKTTQDIVEYYYYWKLTLCEEEAGGEAVEEGSGMSVDEGVGREERGHRSIIQGDLNSDTDVNTESKKRKRYTPEVSEGVGGTWDTCPREEPFNDLTESPSKRFKQDIDVLLTSSLQSSNDIPFFGSSELWLSEFNDGWGEVNTSLEDTSNGTK